MSQYENENSGGLPGLFTAYHQEVQRSAIRRAGEDAAVSEKDYLAAQNSPRFKDLRMVALATTSENARLASKFVDIPSVSMQRSKADASINDHLIDVPSQPHPPSSIAVAKQLVTSFKAKQTKQANVLSQSLKSLQSMSPDDMRLLGAREDLINGLEQQAEATRPARKDLASRHLDRSVNAENSRH